MRREDVRSTELNGQRAMAGLTQRRFLCSTRLVVVEIELLREPVARAAFGDAEDRELFLRRLLFLGALLDAWGIVCWSSSEGANMAPGFGYLGAMREHGLGHRSGTRRDRGARIRDVGVTACGFM